MTINRADLLKLIAGLDAGEVIDDLIYDCKRNEASACSDSGSEDYNGESYDEAIDRLEYEASYLSDEGIAAQLEYLIGVGMPLEDIHEAVVSRSKR